MLNGQGLIRSMFKCTNNCFENKSAGHNGFANDKHFMNYLGGI